MSARRIISTRADGGLTVTAPAYFDRARRLKNAASHIKHTAAGWVLTKGGEILRESDGGLVVSDSDITTLDGQTVFALDQSAFEQWVIARNQEVGVIPAGVAGVAYHIVALTDLPWDDTQPDRTFRNAWEWED